MKCDYPNCRADEVILFYCPYCKGSFCPSHKDSIAHNCKAFAQQTGTTRPTSQSSTSQTPTPQDVMRAFAYQVSRAVGAQQSQTRTQAPPMDEKARKKFIEKKLTERGDLFSFGNEIIDILFGFALIVLVFGFFRYATTQEWTGFVVSGILVATAFLPHELGHKFEAMRRGQFARYILWVRGMMFTLITLIFGIGLIVPGFVAIVPLTRQMNKKDLGIIALAGPATNVVIGLVSLILGLLTHFAIIPFSGLFSDPNIFIQIAQFNALIALFNCIPIWQLDGAKIIKWNKVIFFVLVLANIAIAVPTFILNPSLF